MCVRAFSQTFGLGNEFARFIDYCSVKRGAKEGSVACREKERERERERETN